MTAVATCGWLVACACALRMLALRRRIELVACAEHELRGPLAALSLAAGRARPVEPLVIEGQLERARVALADLAAARVGGRAGAQAARHELRELAERVAAAWRGTGAEVELDWRAGEVAVDADPRRISQALGNLLSNAVEHGGGGATVRGVRAGDVVRIEVADRGPGLRPGGRRPGRGRGLTIAARAAEDAGGRVRIASGPGGALAAVELPVADP